MDTKKDNEKILVFLLQLSQILHLASHTFGCICPLTKYRDYCYHCHDCRPPIYRPVVKITALYAKYRSAKTQRSLLLIPSKYRSVNFVYEMDGS